MKGYLDNNKAFFTSLSVTLWFVTFVMGFAAFQIQVVNYPGVVARVVAEMQKLDFFFVSAMIMPGFFALFAVAFTIVAAVGWVRAGIRSAVLWAIH